MARTWHAAERNVLGSKSHTDSSAHPISSISPRNEAGKVGVSQISCCIFNMSIYRLSVKAEPKEDRSLGWTWRGLGVNPALASLRSSLLFQTPVRESNENGKEMTATQAAFGPKIVVNSKNGTD